MTQLTEGTLLTMTHLCSFQPGDTNDKMDELKPLPKCF